MHATYPTHLILLDFIILTQCGGHTNYEARHYATFLHPPATSSVLGLNTLLSKRILEHHLFTIILYILL
jgi:hypothetical protein